MPGHREAQYRNNLFEIVETNINVLQDCPKETVFKSCKENCRMIHMCIVKT
jgi:hypothetical protein